MPWLLLSLTIAAVLAAVGLCGLYALTKYLTEPEMPEAPQEDIPAPPPTLVDRLTDMVTPTPPSRQALKHKLWRQACQRIRRANPKASRRKVRDKARTVVYDEMHER